MTAMTAADVALLLTNRIAPGAAEPFKAKEFWSLVARIPLGELAGVAPDELGDRLGDPALADRVLTLLDAATSFALARGELESKGIRLLAPGDGIFPDRLIACLGAASPPMLYAAGPVAWLAEPLVGVVGSGSVDGPGDSVAEAVADVAARVGAGIVSGGARGADQLALDAALRAGIPSVGVPAEGLERAARRKEIRAPVGAGRLLIVSPFAPDAGFSERAAMGRNKLIYALATTTLVVASDLDIGETWAGATEALRRGFGAVAVWTGDGAGPGNDALAAHGATPVDSLDAWDPGW
ncbi:MAG: hypothetical protein DHS20C19_01620 [Acidimicrobiales bacterium]|nr:MAG: hypothetical protein DHS20C19_01620 [Acidimicrobiales bacterium]